MVDLVDATESAKKETNSTGIAAAAIGVAPALGAACVAGEVVRSSIGALRPQVMQKYTLDSASHAQNQVEERFIEYQTQGSVLRLQRTSPLLKRVQAWGSD